MLEMFCCNCKTGCKNGSCTCRNAGLILCSSVCGTCSTETCKDFPIVGDIDFDVNDFDDSEERILEEEKEEEEITS